MSSRPRVSLAEPRHGSLPVLLLLLTVVTGVMDAVSILALGRAFVANMTGNVVFAGLALAGIDEFPLLTLVLVVIAFLAGAAAGGVLSDRLGTQRGVLLRAAVLVEMVLLAGCFVVVVATDPAVNSGPAVAVAVVAALAMGLQNSVARRMAVPDLNTNVVTLTMTGLAADHRRAGPGAVLRRACAVVCLFAGAAIGALTVTTAGAAAAFGLLLVLLACVAVTTHALLRRGPDWED